jgi:hypothetical protein
MADAFLNGDEVIDSIKKCDVRIACDENRIIVTGSARSQNPTAT